MTLLVAPVAGGSIGGMTVDSTPATAATVAIETVFRLEFPRLVAGLARRVDDVGLAEDLAQEALADALVQWPRDGVPRNPGAWLMAVAKRRAVDRFRRDRTLAAKYEQLAPLIATRAQLDAERATTTSKTTAYG